MNNIKITALLLMGLVGLLNGQQSYPFVVPPPTGVTSVSTTVIGNQGSNKYSYWVVANFPQGQVAASPGVTVENAPTLDSSNYIRVNWSPVSGAVNYDVIRTVSRVTFPGSCNLCRVASGLTTASYNDQGSAGGAFTYTPIGGVNGSISLTNTGLTVPAFVFNPVIPGGNTIASTTRTLVGDGIGNAIAAVGTAGNCIHVDGSSAACAGSVAVTGNALIGDGAGGAIAATGTGTNCVLVNGSSGTCGSGGVTSVFTRTGAIVAVSGDYTVGQVTNAGSILNPLSQFAATTSAQLAGVISDETGTGALAFANAPALISPTVTGSVSFNSGGGVAGSIDLAQGTAPTAQAANTFRLYTPTGIATAYAWKVPTGDSAGAIVSDGAGTLSINNFSGTGFIARVDNLTYLSFGATPSTSGVLRMSSTNAIAGRNNANTADTGLLDTTVLDVLRLGYNNIASISLMATTNVTGKVNTTVAGTSAGDVVTIDGTQTLTGKTLTTPTIGSFVNATHGHTNAAGGGTLAETALALTNVTTNDATTARHGFVPILPNDATKYYDGTGNFTTPAGTGGSSGGASLFSTTGNTTVTATSPTTLVGTVVGSTTIAANTFTAGQIFHMMGQGVYSTPATPTSLTIALKLAGTTLATTGVTLQIPSVTNGVWSLACDMTTRSVGVAANVMTNCVLIATSGSTVTPSQSIPIFKGSTPAVIDTTGTNVFDLVATWDTTTGSPTITSTNVAGWIPGAPVTSVSIDGGGANTGVVSLTSKVVSVFGQVGTVGAVGDIGATGTIINSAITTAKINNNAVTAQKMAVDDTVRTCVIDNDTQSATALVIAQFSGGCEIPAASTILQVGVWGGTGVIGGTVTTTGTSSVNIQKYTPNGGATTTLMSGNLATASGQACALPATSGTCDNGTTSSGTINISTTALAKGDWIRVSAATPDTAQTWYRTVIVYAIN